MLSRASSDAGTRLRHAKSTSSVRSRGKNAATEPSDPFIVREHATAAAVHAFERAYALDRSRSRPDRSLELARHRSNASRGSQGSHFPPRGSSLRQAGDDSALKRRKSTQSQKFSLERQQSNRPNAVAAPVATPQHHTHDIIPTSTASAPPLPRSIVAIAAPENDPTTPVSKQVRKSRSMYTSWSLGISSSREPRQDAFADISFASQRAKENRAPSTSDMSPGVDATSQPSSKPPAAEEIAAARDKFLQDFQKNKLRTRPSFVFTPFKKRQEKQHNHQTALDYETGFSPHGTSPIGIPAPTVAPARPEEKRTLSGSLKNRFKKVFRKTSKPAISLPVQQVDASRAYFGNSIQATPSKTSPYTDTATPVEDSTLKGLPRPSSRQRASSDISHHSRESTDDHDTNDISKSRVTSWTNSSATNSINNRDANRLSMIPEIEPQPVKKRSSSSLLGRSPFRKTPQASPHGFAKGPDAFDVFSALKSRLERAGLDGNLDPDLPRQPLHDKTERATLPSQTRTSSNTSSKISRATKATIRTVTPEVFGRSRSKERAGEGHHHIDDDDELEHDSPDDDDSGLVLPRIRLQRAAKASIPTPDQIASRKKKSENRWQIQLQQGHSPVFSNNTKRAMTGASPYEMMPLDQSPSPSKSIETPPRTSSRKPQQPVDMLSPGWPSRADIMSPSVYSRDSSGESPVRKESDGSNCPPGTVVIVSSTSAKSYTLGSPSKKDNGVRSVRSSKDWKSWLSKEVSELDLSQDFDMSMTEEWLLKPTTGHQREHAEIVDVGEDEDEIVVFKSRPASSSFPNRPERLTLVDPTTSTIERSKLSGPDEPNLEHGTTTPNSGSLTVDAGRKANTQSGKSSASLMGGKMDKHGESEQIGATSGSSPGTQGPTRDASKTTEPVSTQPPEQEEKIPLSTLTDRPVRNSRSFHSIHRSGGRSQSSLAYYTTSADDPGMPQAPTIPTPPAPAAPVANPPFRFRPAAHVTPTDPSTAVPAARTSAFSRPRSAFDLRHQHSSAQLRPAIPSSPPAGPAATSTQSTAGGTTLLPPPPHHPHHLRRKPVTLGCRRGRTTPSPTPTASPEGEGETMHMIMQGPYSSATSDGRGGEAGGRTSPPWIPPPPPASSSSSPAPGAPPSSARAPRSRASPAHRQLHHPHQLAARQSTPALRVTPRPSEARLNAAAAARAGGAMGRGVGCKENASPAVVTPVGKSWEAAAGEGASEGERETPSPGQLMAERWLSARQQRAAVEGANGVSGSPAFL